MTTARLEHEVGTVRSDVSELRTSLADQGEAIGQVAGQARDLTLIKRIAIGSLVLLLPYLALAGYRAIVDGERLEQVAEDVEEHEAEDGHNGTADEIVQIKVRLGRMDERQRAQTKSLGKLEKTLRRIENEGVPRRRRSL
jgi:hypothetical protein